MVKKIARFLTTVSLELRHCPLLHFIFAIMLSKPVDSPVLAKYSNHLNSTWSSLQQHIFDSETFQFAIRSWVKSVIAGSQPGGGDVPESNEDRWGVET